MDEIGRLGRAVFTALYDYRIPVAVASVVVAGLVLAIAWRRGWFAAARAHPRTSVVAFVTVLAIGMPVASYLAAPIWIRSSLVEAAPTSPPRDVEVAALAPSVAAVVPTAPPILATASAEPSAAQTSSAPSALASGTFSGTDEFHFGRGTATLLEVAPGRYHLRLDDFSVRNGPDLYVYLSTARDGYADDSLELGKLKATDGSFGYDLPAGVDPAGFRSAIIWCKQFSHLFAVAPLST